MVGMRGQPCEYLFQYIAMRSGNGEYVCNSYPSRSECTPGEWCPLVGDKRYHLVPKKVEE